MKRTLLVFFLCMAASVTALAQKNYATDTVRAPLAHVYNIDRLLITLQLDSKRLKVQLGGEPKDEIPAFGERDIRPGLPMERFSGHVSQRSRPGREKGSISY